MLKRETTQASHFIGKTIVTGIALVGVALFGAFAAGDSEQAPAKPQPAAQAVAVDVEVAATPISGRELFNREWIANDPRSHGGDGLGPVFNESSCVACHNQGGAGGAGGQDKNVTLVTAAIIGTQPPVSRQSVPSNTLGRARASIKKVREMLAKRIHPDLAKSNTVVLHRFGVDPQHRAWRQRVSSGGVQLLQNRLSTGFTNVAPVFTNVVQTAPTALSPNPPNGMPMPQAQIPHNLQAFAQPAFVGNTTFPIIGTIQTEINFLRSSVRTDTRQAINLGSALLQKTQRNTTALWGGGLIDRIPDSAILAAAKMKHTDFPQVTGRVHRLAGGKIGRFGWKGHKASLYDFTMAACGTELGLQVPGHDQAKVPYKPDYKPTGLDLNRKEVDALVDFLKELPAPIQRKANHPGIAKQLSEGEQLFATIGCAACHAKKLGNVDGLFSDLLLHDMGPDLGAIGSYGVPSFPEPSQPDPAGNLADRTSEGNPADGTAPGNATPNNQKKQPAAPQVKVAVGPTMQEWRTPPLWGVRDSAPYLHDGRAETLEQAIALHAGESARARLRLFMLGASQRAKVVAFLKSLSAPDAVATRER